MWRDPGNRFTSELALLSEGIGKGKWAQPVELTAGVHLSELHRDPLRCWWQQRGKKVCGAKRGLSEAFSARRNHRCRLPGKLFPIRFFWLLHMCAHSRSEKGKTIIVWAVTRIIMELWLVSAAFALGKTELGRPGFISSSVINFHVLLGKSCFSFLWGRKESWFILPGSGNKFFFYFLHQYSKAPWERWCYQRVRYFTV